MTARWHNETTLMLRRWRVEIAKHAGESGSACHCLRGKGFMRKRRPYGKCAPNEHCMSCEIERQDERRSVRRQRYAGRAECRVSE